MTLWYLVFSISRSAGHHIAPDIVVCTVNLADVLNIFYLFGSIITNFYIFIKLWNLASFQDSCMFQVRVYKNNLLISRWERENYHDKLWFTENLWIKKCLVWILMKLWWGGGVYWSCVMMISDESFEKLWDLLFTTLIHSI